MEERGENRCRSMHACWARHQTAAAFQDAASEDCTARGGATNFKGQEILLSPYISCATANAYDKCSRGIINITAVSCACLNALNNVLDPLKKMVALPLSSLKGWNLKTGFHLICVSFFCEQPFIIPPAYPQSKVFATTLLSWLRR